MSDGTEIANGSASPDGGISAADGSASDGDSNGGEQASFFDRSFWDAFWFVLFTVTVAAAFPYILLKALRVEHADFFPLLSPFYTTAEKTLAMFSCAHAGCVDGWAYLESIARVVFALGMVTSMFAQARVDRYLRHNKLFEYTKVSFRFAEQIESRVTWSVVFLVIAFIALTTLSSPILHNLFALLYLSTLTLIDYLYAYRLSDHENVESFHIKKPSEIARRFAYDLLWKIDAVSLLGLLLISGFTLLLYVYGHSAFDPPAPTKDVQTFVEQHGLVYLFIPHWTEAAEVILSSAVGFQLVVTWGSISLMMRDWEKTLQATMRLSKKLSDKAYSPSPTEGCGEPHCLLPMIRATS